MSEELTNIEMIVFEDDQGKEIEMEIIDEFHFNGIHYVALSEAPQADSDQLLDEDDIRFFRILNENGEEMFDAIEDQNTIQLLADELEKRLLEP